MKIVTVIVSLFFTLCSFAQETISERVETIIPALIQVESHDKEDAIGDNGKAKGVLQLHDVYVAEVNRICILKKNGLIFENSDAFDRSKSIQMASIYLNFWAKQYEKKTGKIADYEALSKMHNGGPLFYKKNEKIQANLNNYWHKVKIQIEKGN